MNAIFLCCGLLLACSLTAAGPAYASPFDGDPQSHYLRRHPPGTNAAGADTIRFLIDGYYLAEAESLAARHRTFVTSESTRGTDEEIWQATALHAEALVLLPRAARQRGLRLLSELEATVDTSAGDAIRRAHLLRLRGTALHHMQKPDSALACFKRAANHLETSVGKKHPEYAATLSFLSRYARYSGEYVASEAMLREAAEIFEKTAGVDSESLYDCFDWLSPTLLGQDKVAEAEAYSRWALQNQRRICGTRAPRLGMTIYRLAGLYYLLGQWGKAIQALDEAPSIDPTRLHQLPDAAFLYGIRGDIAVQCREYALAESLTRKSIQIEQEWGSGRGREQYSLLSLAVILNETGRLSESKQLSDSLRHQLQAQGVGDPDVIGHLDWNLARVAMAQGDTIEASLRLEAMESATKYLFVPGRDGALHALALDRALLLWLRGDVGGALHAAEAVEYKARDYTAGISRQLPDRDAFAMESARTKGASLLLSALLAMPESKEAIRVAYDEVIRSRASVLQVATDRLRAQHADTVTSGLADVLRHLPTDALVVSYVRFERRGEAPGSGRDARGNKPWYVALTVSGDAEPRLIDLGEAGKIDSLASRWHRSLATGRDVESLRLGQSLRARIVDPLIIGNGKWHRLYIVADGTLAMVPFAALPGRDGRPLLGTLPVISYLTAERELVVSGNRSVAERRMLSLGDPDVTLVRHPPSSFTAAVGTGYLDWKQLAEPNFRAAAIADDCDRFETLDWRRLPHSDLEAREVASFAEQAGWPATVLLGSEASESAFRSLSPRSQFIHLACHAFYRPQSCPGDDLNSASALRRGGVVLAGADSDSLYALDRDGIVTAEEVATFDLRSVECVALSGCDTGIGDVVDGQGVVGLRWAFQAAGVRSLVTTLWKVEDAATRAWMREFYLGLFERNEDPAMAAHEASKTLYRWSKRADRGDDISTWGAFVVSGVGRPLRESAAPAASR